jgi:CheY-like chemotaxis protein
MKIARKSAAARRWGGCHGYGHNAELPPGGPGEVTAYLLHLQRVADELDRRDLPVEHRHCLESRLVYGARQLGAVLARCLDSWSAGAAGVSADDLLSEVVEAYTLRYPGLAFRLSQRRSAGRRMQAGPHLELVFLLLLENALRCSVAGGEITICSDTDANRDEWIAHFTDRGPGISPDRIGLVFQDPRRAGPAPLFGFGLTLARSLVEAAGGRLWTESKPGRGAVFSVGLPCSRPARRWLVPRPKVVVIERDPDLRSEICAILSANGCSVHGAARFEAGMAEVRATEPQLVVVEYSPETPEGDVTLSRLCRDSDAEIVLMSACGDKGALADALWRGAADYLTKPFDIRELLVRTRAILRRRQQLPRPVSTDLRLSGITGAISAKPYLQ